MGAIFLLQRLMEKYKEKRQDSQKVLIDSKKAYDKIPKKSYSAS